MRNHDARLKKLESGDTIDSLFDGVPITFKGLTIETQERVLQVLEAQTGEKHVRHPWWCVDADSDEEGRAFFNHRDDGVYRSTVLWGEGDPIDWRALLADEGDEANVIA